MMKWMLLFMFLVVLCVLSFVPIIYSIKHAVISPLLPAVFMYWLWIYRSYKRMTVTFPFHWLWINNTRTNTPHVYCCPSCGHKAIYVREKVGEIKYDMYSGKKKDETSYIYRYECPICGKLEINDTFNQGVFGLEDIEREMFTVNKNEYHNTHR